MRAIAATLAAATLAGCMTPDQVGQRARTMSTAEVCYYATHSMIESSRNVLWAEARSRGQDCGTYASATSAQDAAAISSGVLLLQAAQPKPVTPAPATVICTTRPTPSGATTVCQ